MEFRRLVIAGVLVAAAASLVRALVTHNGVGGFEYIAGVAIVAALLVVAFRTLRRA